MRIMTKKKKEAGEFEQEYFQHKGGETFEVWHSKGKKRCPNQSKRRKQRRLEGENISSQCTKSVLPGYPACHWHGKNSLRGAASPTAKTLEYSKYPLGYTHHLKGKRKTLYEENLKQAELSLLPEIALNTTLIQEALSDAPSQEDMYKALVEISDLTQQALEAGYLNDTKGMIDNIEAIQAKAGIVNGGGGDDKKVLKLIEYKAKLVATEVKNVASMEATMQMSVVNLMLLGIMQSLGNRLLEFVEDKKVISAIMKQTKDDIDRYLPVFEEVE
jgi:hypothetical protein